MINQDEEFERRKLFENLTGPNPKTDLAHSPVLGRKLKDIGIRDNKLVSVLTRTFFIGFPDYPVSLPDGSEEYNTGAAFALDIQGKQYLITASHVVGFSGGVGVKGVVRIAQNDKWSRFEMTVVGRGDGNNPEDDIAVLAANVRLPIPLTHSEESFEPSVTNIFWGQRVYFCGFPYSQRIETDVIKGYPFAMTKGGILSGMHTQSGTSYERERGLFILDGINNIGFSGGPAVFQLKEDQNADFQVFGVISGYRESKLDIKKGDEKENKPTDFFCMENTGLIYCPSIMRAIDMIEANPIGFENSAL